MWKFSPGENFLPFHHLLSLVKVLSHEFCPVLIKAYMEEIYSTVYFLQYKVARFGELFVQHTFSRLQCFVPNFKKTYMCNNGHIQYVVNTLT